MFEEIKLTVHPFYMDHNKAAAIKVLEEASEVRAAWQRLDLAYARANDDKGYMPALRTELADEIADVIQAACNLAARYNLNVADAMTRCEERNRERGRYSSGPIFGEMRHSTPDEQECFEEMLRRKSEPIGDIGTTGIWVDA